MLHLDPSHPPLWRTPDTLQFGRAGLVRIEDPSLWQLRLIRELDRGVPEIALAALARSLGAHPDDIEDFVARIDPVLLRQRQPHRVLIEVADDPSAALAGNVREALRDLGVHARLGDHAAERPDAVVLLAAHALHPRRAAGWLREDIPHLPLVLGNGTAEIGPLVLPGASACLSCLAAHERDRDPSWPVLTAQLVGRADPVGPATLALEAALHAGRMIIEARAGQTLVIDRSADVLRRHWAPHPECSCGAPAGTATAPCPANPSTTTATANAVPA